MKSLDPSGDTGTVKSFKHILLTTLEEASENDYSFTEKDLFYVNVDIAILVQSGRCCTICHLIVHSGKKAEHAFIC